MTISTRLLSSQVTSGGSTFHCSVPSLRGRYVCFLLEHLLFSSILLTFTKDAPVQTLCLWSVLYLLTINYIFSDSSKFQIHLFVSAPLLLHFLNLFPFNVPLPSSVTSNMKHYSSLQCPLLLHMYTSHYFPCLTQR